MDFAQLEAFLAVAAERHFGRAADRLHISQPQLSKKVMQLERELRLQLFDRTTRTVVLTAAGEALLKPVGQVERTMADVRTSLAEIREGSSGRVIIGFSGGSASYVIPALTKALRDQLPNLDVQLRGKAFPRESLARLLDGTMDLAYSGIQKTMDVSSLSGQGIGVKLVGPEVLACAMPSNHRLADQSSVTVHDLVNEDFVGIPATSGSVLWSTVSAMCEEAGFFPKVVQEATDELMLLTLAAAGVGICVMPRVSCELGERFGLVHRPLMGGENRFQTALLWNQRAQTKVLTKVLEVEASLNYAHLEG